MQNLVSDINDALKTRAALNIHLVFTHFTTEHTTHTVLTAIFPYKPRLALHCRTTQLNVYSPIKQTNDTEVRYQMHGRLPDRPKPIYAGHQWL